MAADLATDVHLVTEKLLELLARPGEPSPESLEQALRLFELTGEPLLWQWIEHEVSGYGMSGAVSLKATLGVADDSLLASRVRSYRQHTGRVRTEGASGRRLQVPYFFGEPLQTLLLYRANAEATTVEFLEVEHLPPSQAQSPIGAPVRTLEFPRHVFHRILSGLAVELEVMARSILKRFPVTPA